VVARIARHIESPPNEAQHPRRSPMSDNTPTEPLGPPTAPLPVTPTAAPTPPPAGRRTVIVLASVGGVLLVALLVLVGVLIGRGSAPEAAPTEATILLQGETGTGKEAIAEAVVIRPACRGRGLGRAMMHAAMALAAEKGAYKLALSSNLRRLDAHRFYDGMGFTRHGVSFSIDVACRHG